MFVSTGVHRGARAEAGCQSRNEGSYGRSAAGVRAERLNSSRACDSATGSVLVSNPEPGQKVECLQLYRC